jgi:hypothetical protein
MPLVSSIRAHAGRGRRCGIHGVSYHRQPPPAEKKRDTPSTITPPAQITIQELCGRDRTLGREWRRLMLALDVKVESQRACRRALFAVVLAFISVGISLIALAVAVRHELVRSVASQVAAASGQPAPLARVPTKAEIKHVQDMWKRRRMRE